MQTYVADSDSDSDSEHEHDSDTPQTPHGGAGRGAVSVEEYERHPELKFLHTAPDRPPEFEQITLEQWLTCKRNRSPHLNWEKAIQYCIDKGVLASPIRSPAQFVDRYLSIYEEEHRANIQSAEQKARERDRDLQEVAQFLAEGGMGPESCERIKREYAGRYGQEFISEAEAISKSI